MILFRSSALARAGTDAFSRSDLVVLLAALAVLATVGWCAGANHRQKAGINVCLANLHEVDRAILEFCRDHGNALPGAISGQPGEFWWWYKEQVKSYVGLSGPSSTNDRVFACPADRGYSDATPFSKNARFDYGSYVFNGVTLPGVPNVAGWKMPSIVRPERTLLVMEWTAHAPLSWHKSRTGGKNAPFYRDAESVVAFADGHAKLTKIYYDGYTAAYTRNPVAGYEYKYSGN